MVCRRATIVYQSAPRAKYECKVHFLLLANLLTVAIPLRTDSRVQAAQHKPHSAIHPNFQITILCPLPRPFIGGLSCPCVLPKCNKFSLINLESLLTNSVFSRLRFTRSWSSASGSLAPFFFFLATPLSSRFSILPACMIYACADKDCLAVLGSRGVLSARSRLLNLSFLCVCAV